MSGIAGIIHFDGEHVAPGLVETMTGAMAHRGPDGMNHWVRGSVALGQCMLRTTPESLEEHQPLTNEDESLVLVMDGRVDNWQELRRELLVRGAVLRDRSDAELVLKSYATWGRECLPHIDGDFAFAIWDATRNEVFLARDRMGSKPLNYHWDGKTLVFASELNTIVRLPWVKRELNEGVLAEFLAAEWYSMDETFWNGVMRLMPAHQLVVAHSGPTAKEQYWEPNLCAELPYAKDEQYVEHYREVLFDSVRRLSRSHRSLAIEVSGGLDSSGIACVAEHLRRRGTLSAPCIDAYTLPFEDDPQADELSYARAVASHLGIRIHEVLPSRMPLSWFEDRAHAFLDFPGFPNATMGQGLLSRAASNGSRAILNGIGGDEWLAGSRSYYAEELARHRWRSLRDCIRRDAREFGTLQAMEWLARYGCFAVLPARIQSGARRLVRQARGRSFHDTSWLASNMKDAIARRRSRVHRARTQPARSAGQGRLLEFRFDPYLAVAREEAERLYAGFGLEPRRPLHTAAFVQFAFSTPERMRLRGDRHKYIHVQGLKDLMPQSVLERKTKAEFSVMFRRCLDESKQTLIESLPRRRPEWVTDTGMTKLFQAYESNPSTGWPLWVLWSLLGCDIFVTRAVRKGSPSPTL